jgi:tRNA(Glu) U13 pseudouridine synthase TruD
MRANHRATSFEEFWQRLEAERNDISYRNPIPKPLEKVVVKEVKKVPERLKKIYFHAGRYAAGDRDSLATEAHAQFEKLEA